MAHNNQQLAVQLMLPPSGKAAIYARGAPGVLKSQKLQTKQLHNVACTFGYEAEQIIVYEEESVSGKSANAKRQAIQELLHEVRRGAPTLVLLPQQ